MWRPGQAQVLQSAWARVAGQMDLTPCNGCHQCSIRCAEGVQMTRGEYNAVRSFAEKKADQARLAEVLEQDKLVDLGDGCEVRMCRYLDMERRGCVVYEARPLVCRLLGHVEWLPCPIGKVEREVNVSDAVALMQAYSTEERHTFEQWEEIIGRECT